MNRRDAFVAGTLAALCLLVGAWRMVPGVTGVYHDDGVYVATGKALAEGAGYRLINLPDAPPQTKYPPAYPLMLAAIWKLAPEFPDNVRLMQFFTLATAAAALGLSYLYLIRFGYCGRLTAVVVGLLCATSTSFSYFSTLTMAEMPFALLTVAALWRLERSVVAPSTSARGLVTGVVLALPALCRPAGLAFVVGGLVLLVVRRRPFVWILLGSALTLAPWFLWVFVNTGGADDPWLGYYRSPVSAWSHPELFALGSVMRTNATLVLVALPMTLFSGLVASFALDSVVSISFALVVGVATWLAVGAGLLRNRPLAICAAVYVAMLLCWPWPPARFLLPLAPLLGAFLWTGASTVINPIRRHLSSTAIRIAVGLIAVAAIAANVHALQQVRTVSHASRYPFERMPSVQASWDQYEALFDWLRQRPDPGATIAAGLDTMTFLYADHPGIRPFPHRPGSLLYGAVAPSVGTASDFAEMLRVHHVRYVVETPMPSFLEEAPFRALVEDVRTRNPGLLTEVYRGADVRFVVYAVSP